MVRFESWMNNFSFIMLSIYNTLFINDITIEQKYLINWSEINFKPILHYQPMSLYHHEAKVFSEQAARLLHPLPATSAQIQTIIQAKHKIDSNILSFDPECQRLKAEILNLNSKSITQLFFKISKVATLVIINNLSKFKGKQAPSSEAIMDEASQVGEAGMLRLLMRNLGISCMIKSNDPSEYFSEIVKVIYEKLHSFYSMKVSASKQQHAVNLMEEMFASQLQVQELSEDVKLKQQMSRFIMDPHEDDDDYQIALALHLQEEHQKHPNENIKPSQQKQLFKLSTQAEKLKDRKEIQSLHQNQLPFMTDKVIEWTLFQNLQHQNELIDPQVKQIQEIIKLSKESLNKRAKKMLKESDIEAIIKLIMKNFEEYEAVEATIGKSINIWHRKNFTSRIEGELKDLCPCTAQSTNYLYLVKVLYEALKAGYTPPAKRFLMDILRDIEVDHLNNQGPYLRGALRYFEADDINPSSIGAQLSRKKPQRSQAFLTSFQSCLKKHNTNFIPHSVADGAIKEAILSIHAKLHYERKPPLLQFVKLNYTQGRKTITILISGFLSKNTKKDLDWMNLIHVLGNSELYAIRWESCSIPELIVSGWKFLSRKQVDPFSKAFEEAQFVGIYLAQFLIQHFSDRFINLVGFSLGTRVIFCCLKHLLLRRRSDLINRIITLGGVADRAQFESLLRETHYPMDWLNFWSMQDWTVRLLFKFWNNSYRPIGGEKVGAVKGHTVRNVDFSSIVTGHLKYENKLYAVGKMSNIFHD